MSDTVIKPTHLYCLFTTISFSTLVLVSLEIASSLLTVSGTVTNLFLVIKFLTSSLGLSANLTSLFVIIPNRTPFLSVTGKPETPCIFFKAKISFNVSF